jgi:hypothetical protein
MVVAVFHVISVQHAIFGCSSLLGVLFGRQARFCFIYEFVKEICCCPTVPA